MKHTNLLDFRGWGRRFLFHRRIGWHRLNGYPAEWVLFVLPVSAAIMLEGRPRVRSCLLLSGTLQPSLTQDVVLPSRVCRVPSRKRHLPVVHFNVGVTTQKRSLQALLLSYSNVELQTHSVLQGNVQVRTAYVQHILELLARTRLVIILLLIILIITLIIVIVIIVVMIAARWSRYPFSRRRIGGRRYSVALLPCMLRDGARYMHVRPRGSQLCSYLTRFVALCAMCASV